MLYISLILNLLLLSVMVGLGHHYKWKDKFLGRISWKENPKSLDYLITESWTHTMESLNYDADIVLFGASLTSDGHWEDFFDTLNICNLGKSGDRLETMLWRIPQIAAVKPHKIFLSMEHNDMHDLTIEEINKAYNTLIDTITQTNPQAMLYLESLTPLNERQFERVCDNEKCKQVNEMINRVAIERGVPYIDIYSIYEEDGQLPMSLSTDGQHLKPEAYEFWANALLQYIR